MAATWTRRAAARKATAHDWLGSSLRLALAQPIRNSAPAWWVGMLALGIGATVAVFSLINGLFLRPFPFPGPDRLVYINEAAPKWNLEQTGVSFADFTVWHRDQQAFEAIALYDTTAFNAATDEGADRMNGAGVTIDFLKVLGLQPLRGRSFTVEETKPNGPRVAMIGEALWHERFGGRADVLGKELRLNSRVYTVVGVLPKAAEFPGGVRLWVPMQDNPTDRDGYSYDGLGRLKAGITVEQATADLLRVQQQISTSTTRNVSSRHSHASCARNSRASSARLHPRLARQWHCCSPWPAPTWPR